jgi:anti-sigma regulatory factor (Ser/Thr protein kinase)
MEAMTGGVSTVLGASILLVIDEATQVGAARRSATALGTAHGLGTDAVGRLAIVVTEAANNVVRHAGGGVIVLRAFGSGESATIEMLALDKGRGIPDVARAMGDGFSTSGTAGQGLGGMQRLSDEFEIYSQRNVGTVLMARVREGGRPSAGTKGRVIASLDDRLGVLCVAMSGQTECGDSWRVVEKKGHISVLLVDGLGHGAGAAAVAATVAETFSRVANGSPDRTLASLDDAARGSRGAAASVTVIDEVARSTTFSGVGNVDGRILSNGPPTHFVPQNGIVGHTMPTIRTVPGPWPRGATLVMHSDGISAKWRLNVYPGLMTAHPALIAGVIYRDFARGNDDATVVVLGGAPAGARR